MPMEWLYTITFKYCSVMPPTPFTRVDFLSAPLFPVDEEIELSSWSGKRTWLAMRIQASPGGPASVVFPLDNVIVNDLIVKSNLSVDRRVVANEVATNNIQVDQKVIANEVATQDVVVGHDITLQNADCAEEFDVISNEVEPGTVMVLNQDGILEPSSCAYDKRVAGVVSGAGDLRPGIILDKHKDASGVNNRIPIALMGKVNCKVDANYSSVEIGDLLTASPSSGHAMKAVNPLKAFGTVIGKALRPLAEGQGLIPVLVALQ